MSIEANPYAPPKAFVHDVVRENGEADAIRHEHIKHEASVRSIGTLYYLGGGLVALMGLVLLAGTVRAGRFNAMIVLLVVLYLGLGVLAIVAGRGIRALQPWARMTGIVLAAIGLLGFPVGTLINAYVLWLLLSQKGKRIFQEDYQAIVAATPHIKYRTSKLVWILLGVIVLVIVAAITIPMLTR